jgi:carbon storage regulator
MLIVTRNKGQRIMIGDDVVVTVLDVRGKQVRIGIDAPENINILREELLEDVNDHHNAP